MFRSVTVTCWWGNGGSRRRGCKTDGLLRRWRACYTSAMELLPLTGCLGAEVQGVDLASPLDDDAIAAIRAAFNEHHVLFFRNQAWDHDQQLAFGRRFGDLDTHPFVEGNPEHPEILDVITEPDDVANFGGGWHTDVTFLPEPDLGSILYLSLIHI